MPDEEKPRLTQSGTETSSSIANVTALIKDFLHSTSKSEAVVSVLGKKLQQLSEAGQYDQLCQVLRDLEIEAQDNCVFNRVPRTDPLLTSHSGDNL